ncbi:hypothetical protein FH972_023991 [Carpinus fangiana]|uniref:Peptidase S9 prolyl oligopeptidase catalytic domain-containing protein n=1 Tax=Carpinus fangiana TaxID=176857 RepID=A0A5N6KXF5_9ROSI|nr:hypothetical protein FH972_023991 [Carpinus fangiana]
MNMANGISEASLYERLLLVAKPTGVRISPSATRVIYAVYTDTEPTDEIHSALWAADVGKEESAFPLTSGGWNDTWPQWTHDSSSVIFRTDRGHRGTLSSLFRIDLRDSDNPIRLTSQSNQKTIQQFEVGPSGSAIAFNSEDEQADQVVSVHVHGQKGPFSRLRLLHLDTNELDVIYSRDRNICSFAWMQGSDTRIVLITTESTHLDYTGSSIEILDVATRSVTHTIPFPGAIIDRPVWPSHKESPQVSSSQDIYFLAGATPNSEQSSRAVYRCNLDDSITTRVANGTQDCARGLAVAGKIVFSHVLAGLDDEVTLVNAAPDEQRHFILDSAIESFDVQISPDDPNNYVLAYATGNVSSPPEVFTFKQPLRGVFPARPMQLSDHGSIVTEFCDSTCQTLTCPSSDSTTSIEAIFLTPKGPSTSPLPTVVFLHGGPYYRARNEFSNYDHSMTHALLARNYAILNPNYRGSAGRGEAFAACLKGAVSTFDYDDIVALVVHAIEQRLVDPARLLVCGWSQGGFLAFLCAVRNAHAPFRFRGAIAGAGISDWDMFVLDADNYRANVDLVGGAPWTQTKDSVASRRASPIWEVYEAEEVPAMLIMHGEADTNVPMNQSTGFYRACVELGIPVEYVTYPGEGHVVRNRAFVLDIIQRTVDFCDRLIGG